MPTEQKYPDVEGLNQARVRFFAAWGWPIRYQLKNFPERGWFTVTIPEQLSWDWHVSTYKVDLPPVPDGYTLLERPGSPAKACCKPTAPLAAGFGLWEGVDLYAGPVDNFKPVLGVVIHGANGCSEWSREQSSRNWPEKWALSTTAFYAVKPE